MACPRPRGAGSRGFLPGTLAGSARATRRSAVAGLCLDSKTVRAGSSGSSLTCSGVSSRLGASWKPRVCGRSVGQTCARPPAPPLASGVGVVLRRTLPLTCGVRPGSGESVSELNRITGRPAGVRELVLGPRGRRHQPTPWESLPSGTSVAALGRGWGVQCPWATEKGGRGSAFLRWHLRGGFVGSER